MDVVVQCVTPLLGMSTIPIGVSAIETRLLYFHSRFLLMDTDKTEVGSSTWAPTIQVPDGVLSSWLQPGLAFALTTSWGTESANGDFTVSFFLISAPFSNPQHHPLFHFPGRQ